MCTPVEVRYRCQALTLAKADNGLALLCRAGAYLCALPLAHVGETMRPLPIEPLAGTPDFVRGVAIIRGTPTPVIDAARLTGDTRSTAATRFVTLKVGERRAALAVDAVLGVRDLGLAEASPLAPLFSHAAGEIVAAMGTLDRELLLVLEAARIVPESVWSALGAIT